MPVARVKWVHQRKFVGVTPSGHEVPFDSDREANTAPGAMEMLLCALGACTATDVVIILAKKRQKLESLELEISGERAAENPRVWVKIDIVFRLRGQLDDKAVRQAIELSESKYCSVSAMLRKTAQMSFRHEILPGQ